MKSNTLVIIGICLFLLGSCAHDLKETDDSIPQLGELVEVTAYADHSQQTKTGLVDKEGGGKSVVWKSGTSISLFFNSGSSGGDKFTTTTDGPIASFLGRISAVSGDLSGLDGDAYFWGLYPYSPMASCNGSAITTSLPANQMAYQGNVADNLLVTVGRSNNLSIYFRNTCAVVGFTVSQENIKKIVFAGNTNEAVAGEYQISFDNNNAIVDTPTVNASGSITIKPADTSTFAVLPGTLSEGFSLSFTKKDGSMAIFTRETSCTFAASMFYTMTNKDNGLSFSAPVPGGAINNDGYNVDSNWDNNSNSDATVGKVGYGNDVNWG